MIITDEAVCLIHNLKRISETLSQIPDIRTSFPLASIEKDIFEAAVF